MGHHRTDLRAAARNAVRRDARLKHMTFLAAWAQGVDEPTLPVILMTGYLYDRDHVIKRSKLAGLATGVLYKKPIDLERLKSIIHTHCSPKETHGDDRREPGRNPAVP